MARSLRGWTDLGPVTHSDLGRASEAGRQIGSQLRRLGTFAAEVRLTLDPYARPRSFPGSPSSADPSTIGVGSLDGPPMQVTVPHQGLAAEILWGP